MTRLHGRISHGTLTLAWSPVCAATGYVATVGSGRKAKSSPLLTGTRYSTRVGKTKQIAVSVVAVGFTSHAGPAAHITAR